jgi:peroxiredoxin
MARTSTTLRVGGPAPAFELRDAATNVTRPLEDLLRERRALLLVFHRGMW